MHQIRRLFALLLLSGLVSLPVHAETFHTCGTLIASIPSVISTAGVYCLSHDVNTAITSGNAIAINTNNVTLDCNGYKIGGLAAGTSSTTYGVSADTARQNITVRNCGIRGFFSGISLTGGAGHLVEDNRLDNNLFVGIEIGGDNNRVQRNRVYDTGGRLGSDSSICIVAAADVIDNTVAGVFATNANTIPSGIQMTGIGTEARGNQVRGLIVAGTGAGYGISASATNVAVRNNAVAASSATVVSGVGIFGNGATDTICSGNNIFKLTTPMTACKDGGSNTSD